MLELIGSEELSEEPGSPPVISGDTTTHSNKQSVPVSSHPGPGDSRSYNVSAPNCKPRISSRCSERRGAEREAEGLKSPLSSNSA